MIVRVVKMTFRAGTVPEFRGLFEGWRHRIIAHPGCRKLELLQVDGASTVLFTISEWETAEDLERYRRSDVFAEVWPVVKKLFSAKAEAWTLDRLYLMTNSHA